MSESVKLKSEDIDSVKQIQTKYLQVQQGIGQVRVSLIKLDQQRDVLMKAEADLNNKFLETQKEEQELLKSMNDSYGDGTLDIENGVFIPNTEN